MKNQKVINHFLQRGAIALLALISLSASFTANAAPAPLYYDGNPDGLTWWILTGNQNYGYKGSVPYAAATGKTVGCIKKCPQSPVPSSRSVSDPTSCVCNAAGYHFSKATWQCTTCPFGQFLNSSGVCACPQGYKLKNMGGANVCRPVEPLIPGSSTATEFRSSVNADPNLAGYPVCGEGRMPVKQNFEIQNFASSNTPNIAGTAPFEGANFPFATPSPTASPGVSAPYYRYANQEHCACSALLLTPAPNPISAGGAAALPATVAGGKPRFYPDTLDIISLRGAEQKPSSNYGMVSIAKDPSQDGRLGSVWDASGAFCGCPNLNEKAVPLSTDHRSGVQCVSALSEKDLSKVKFVQYNEAIDDISGRSNVMNRSQELGANKKVLSTIKLPVSSGNPLSLQVYSRMIWKCKDPFKLVDGACTFDFNQHKCGDDSPVSSDVTGVDAKDRFRNAVNKKLACCVNSGVDSGMQKFDCIENTNRTDHKVFTDFNSLWQYHDLSSGDAQDDGGQMAAIFLTDRRNKPLTGFYTLAGERCSGYSEFSTDPIQSGHFSSTGAFVPDSGGTIKTPTSSGYTELATGFPANQMRVPADAEKKRCPILVRAAIVVSCPQISQGSPGNFPVYEIKDAKGMVIQRRCPVAESVQVKIRVEQVYRTDGVAPLDVIDTVADAKSAASISVPRIIQNRWGNWCPPGSTKQGGNCVY